MNNSIFKAGQEVIIKNSQEYYINGILSRHVVHGNFYKDGLRRKDLNRPGRIIVVSEDNKRAAVELYESKGRNGGNIVLIYDFDNLIITKQSVSFKTPKEQR